MSKLADSGAALIPTTVDISLVICTRDRPIPLAACLSALSGQSVRPREVIVVDNASQTGETRDVVIASGATYLREDRPGLDFARNAGAMAARGAIVAYTDDDVVLHPRWLERMAAAFDDPAIAVVTGLVLPAELETEAQRLFEFHWSFGRGYERIDFGAEFFARGHAGACPTWEIGAGASMAFRREVLERIGYFDERLDVGQSGCSGDSEAWHRVLAAGYTCRYEPGIAAFHYHRREMKDLARQIRAYMRGHSSSVLVQFGTTRRKGNLIHIFRDLPRNYFWRLRQRVKEGRSDHNRLLRYEIAGFFSGILFIALRIGSPVRRRLRG
jgi:GT2 family glycosyltransferase